MIIPKIMEGIKITGKFNADYSKVPNAIYKAHEGVDMGTPIGTPVISDTDSIVIDVKNGVRGYGRFVVLQDTKDKRIFYLGAHLSEIFLVKWQTVKKGSVIGKSGNTGGLTGVIAAHLHSGVYIVDSQAVWNSIGTGFYYSDKYYVNQKLAVNPYNYNEKWKGA